MSTAEIPFALATADAVQAVVCACHRDWTPPLMARITTKKKHRVPRINTLGNGQVPLCAAVAFVWGFEILREVGECFQVLTRRHPSL